MTVVFAVFVWSSLQFYAGILVLRPWFGCRVFWGSRQCYGGICLGIFSYIFVVFARRFWCSLLCYAGILVLRPWFYFGMFLGHFVGKFAVLRWDLFGKRFGYVLVVFAGSF